MEIEIIERKRVYVAEGQSCYDACTWSMCQTENIAAKEHTCCRFSSKIIQLQLVLWIKLLLE